MKRVIVAALMASCAVLAGCSAPADLDGEVTDLGVPLGHVSTAAPGHLRTPVVVDTDLGADDLVALAFLLHHPDVDVRAITIAANGLVGCDPGLDVLGGLLSSLAVPAPPVACGHGKAGPEARSFPAAWRTAAASGSGVAPDADALTARPEPAARLIAQLAREAPGLVLLALGPLTTVAEVAAQHPRDYARLAGVHAMSGSVEGPLVDGVAEWNAAADPSALAKVLAGAAPLVLVPEDAVPQGTPTALHIPVVDRVTATAQLPGWWDLATAAVLVAPESARAEEARWVLDPSSPGRLRNEGRGSVRVVRSVDSASLDAAYARASDAG